MRCAFCELPEVKQRTILKTQYSFAFPTNIPITPGHTLVCPIRCVKTMDDLTQNERDDLEGLRKTIAQALTKTFTAEGFHYAWNDGAIAGQSVPHLHLHVIPRKKGDDGITEYEPRKFLYRPGSREPTPEKELQAVAKLIREIL
jgi:histidine triad (HIT) family protein